MKRNSMLTKIIAVLLCALMVAAWLPKTSAAANDFESGMDRIYGADAANAMPLVIGTNADSGLANAYYAYTPAEDGTLTLTAEDGTTFTVDGVAYTDAVAVTAGTKYIIVATNEAKAHSFDAAFEVAPTGPVYKAVLDSTRQALSFQDEILGQFVYDGTKIAAENFDKIYLHIKPVAVDSEDRLKEVTLTELHPQSTSSMYFYTYGVWSRCMADEIDVTLYAEKDGTTYCGNTLRWSVKAQAMKQIENYMGKANYARVTMYVDMLNFGAAMQDNNKYHMANLANDQLTDAHKAYATKVNPALDVTVPAITKADYELYTLALYTSERTGLQIAFKLPSGYNLDDYAVAATKDGVTTYKSLTKLNNTVAVLIYSDLNAKQMRKDVNFKLCSKDADGNWVAVNDLSYDISIATVAKMRVDAGKLFAYEMMKYGDSVLANYPN